MRIILGVTGGIAAYKAADLARLLIKDGHEVQAVLTRSAEEFVTQVTFASLTGRKVLNNLFEASAAIEHIDVAQSNDLLVVAPRRPIFLRSLLTDWLAVSSPRFIWPSAGRLFWHLR